MDTRTAERRVSRHAAGLRAFEGVADGANYRAAARRLGAGSGRHRRLDQGDRSGRYKAVNMAGASVISALLNRVDRRDLPFVFGGDGAFVAIPGSAIEATRGAGGGQDLGRGRIATRPARGDRPDGRHPRARPRRARRPLPGQFRDRSYAMFTGGGASWAEAQMKAGNYAVGARAGRHAAGPHRPLLPLEPDRGAPWRDRFHHRHAAASRERRSRSSNWFPTSSHWPASRSAAAIPVPADGPDTAFRRAGWNYEVRATAPKGGRGCGRSSSFSPR